MLTCYVYFRGPRQQSAADKWAYPAEFVCIVVYMLTLLYVNIIVRHTMTVCMCVCIPTPHCRCCLSAYTDRLRLCPRTGSVWAKRARQAKRAKRANRAKQAKYHCCQYESLLATVILVYQSIQSRLRWLNK
jgi:hypothetical protein